MLWLLGIDELQCVNRKESIDIWCRSLSGDKKEEEGRVEWNMLIDLQEVFCI